VPGRWLRLTRRSPSEGRTSDVPTELTAVFLDMDKRQGIAQAAVASEGALHPRSPIITEWEEVQQHCYSAAAAFLSLTGGDPGAVTTAAEVHRQLSDAAAGVDDFYQRHLASLDRAAATAVATAARADSALAEANRVSTRLSGIDRAWLDYPSIQTAKDLLEAATVEFRAARQSTDLNASQSAADRLTRAAAALGEALDSAPQRAGDASRTVASVRTRLEAARTRAGGMGDTMSALLRDFRGESSADLMDNERRSWTHLDRADELLRQALDYSMKAQPEVALDLATQARAAIGAAEDLVDAASDRLALLIVIRDEPGQREREVRFRLRDAQRLAVDRGADTEWGTVLDAQVPRIDRIVEDLNGRHPDYWKYHRELEQVSEFVAGIVARIRQRPVQ